MWNFPPGLSPHTVVRCAKKNLVFSFSTIIEGLSKRNIFPKMQIKNVKNSTLFFNPSLSGPTGQTATWCRSRHEISPSLGGKDANRLRRSLSVSFLTQTDLQSVSLNLRSKYIIQYHHLNYMISIPFTV